MKKTIRTYLTLVALGSLGTSAQAAVIADFNSYASDAAFLVDFTNTGAGGTFQWANLAGVGGTGVMRSNSATNSDATVQYDVATENWTTGSSYTVSTLFKFLGDDTGASSTFAQVGIMGNLGQNFNSGTTGAFLTGRLRRINSTVDYVVETQYQVASGGAATVIGTSATFEPTAFTINNWYLLQATFTRLGSDNVSSAVSLVDYGASGTAPGATLSTSSSGTFSIAGAGNLYSDTATYVGLRSSSDNASVNFDNITAVPEPSSWALLALGLAGIVGLRRRRAA